MQNWFVFALTKLQQPNAIIDSLWSDRKWNYWASWNVTSVLLFTFLLMSIENGYILVSTKKAEIHCYIVLFLILL